MNKRCKTPVLVLAAAEGDQQAMRQLASQFGATKAQKWVNRARERRLRQPVAMTSDQAARRAVELYAAAGHAEFNRFCDQRAAAGQPLSKEGLLAAGLLEVVAKAAAAAFLANRPDEVNTHHWFARSLATRQDGVSNASQIAYAFAFAFGKLAVRYKPDRDRLYKGAFQYAPQGVVWSAFLAAGDDAEDVARLAAKTQYGRQAVLARA